MEKQQQTLKSLTSARPKQDIKVTSKINQGTSFSFEIYKNIQKYSKVDELKKSGDKKISQIPFSKKSNKARIEIQGEKSSADDENGKLSTNSREGYNNRRKGGSGGKAPPKIYTSGRRKMRPPKNGGGDSSSSKRKGSHLGSQKLVTYSNNNSQSGAAGEKMSNASGGHKLNVVILDDDVMILNVAKLYIKRCFTEWKEEYCISAFYNEHNALEYVKVSTILEKITKTRELSTSVPFFKFFYLSQFFEFF